MIYLRLAGGLGNQLFQLAAACLCCLRNNSYVVIVDKGLAGYKQKRGLDSFKLFSKPAWLCSDSKPPLFVDVLANKLRIGKLPIPGISINDRNFRPADFSSLSLPFWFMDGYFQTCWSYKTIVNVLPLMNFYPSKSLSNFSLDAYDVAVHVRGSDFLSLDTHNIISSHFYYKAILSAVKAGHYSFVFYTDDLPYCRMILDEMKALFPEAYFRLASSSGAIYDFCALRAANFRIIGNSTFAWWAALLSHESSTTWSHPLFAKDLNKPFALPSEIYIC